MIRSAMTTAALTVGLAASPMAHAQPVTDLEPLTAITSPFHGIHGLRFDRDGLLYAASVIGQSIFTVDVDTGEAERLIAPPQGMADDIAIAPDGTMFWTAIEDGIVYKRGPDGRIERFLEGVKGANAISYSRDFERLFYTLVFYGDALYELDPSGRTPPRLISEDHGGLNAFEVAHDGMIYGPLVFGGRVVKVDPDTGEFETVSDDFEGPGALKLGGDGTAFVLDETHLKRVVLASGETRTVTELPSGGDNLAVSDVGLVYVSLAAENAIVEVDPTTGTYGYLVGPSPLVSPAGLALSADGATLYVGDMFGGLRAIEVDTALAAARGAAEPDDAPSSPPFGRRRQEPEAAPTGIRDIPTAIFQPTHVHAGAEHLIAVGEVFGEIERLDPETGTVVDRYEGFDAPHDVLETRNGDLIVAEAGGGHVSRVAGPAPGRRSIVAADLDEPNGLAWAADDAIYVTETGAGRLLRVELASGTATVVADGLAQPEGVAVDRRGRAFVVEVGAQRIVRISDNGRRRVVAENLPIGLSNGPSLYRGIAVDADGDIFIASDIDNTIYRLDP